MTDRFEPDERFVEKLEWQLASEQRRLSRWPPPARRVSFSRRAVAAGLMVGVMLFGVTVIKAAEYLKDSWRKKIEVARAETAVRLAKLRLDTTREMSARTDGLLARRLVSKDECPAVARAVSRADAAWNRTRLDLEEVTASGEPPRNELYAPLVDGRDFAGERLEIDGRDAEEDLKQAEAARERISKLIEEKLVSAEELEGLTAAITARKATLEEIRKRQEMRKRYLSGAVTAQEVEIQGRLTSAEANVKSARAKVESFERQFERLSALERRKMVESLEVSHMRAALEAARAELKLAEMEKAVLQKAL